eukprot:470913-Hanusia_phi.AAC.2
MCHKTWAQSRSTKDLRKSSRGVSPDECLQVASKNLKLGSVFHCSNTVAVFLSFTVIQFFYFSIGVLGLFSLYRESASSHSFSSSKFRFSILETRSSQIRNVSYLPTWGVSNDHRLRSLDHAQTVKLGEGEVVVEASLEADVNFDGCFFNTSTSCPPEYDPVRFKVRPLSRSSPPLTSSSQFFFWTGDRWQAASSSSDVDYAGDVEKLLLSELLTCCLQGQSSSSMDTIPPGANETPIMLSLS